MSQPERRQCIYCLLFKIYAIGKIRKQSEFNSEHVLHQSVAKGFKNAPTLIGRVCTACNQNFGDTIDTVFGRSGYEGFQRFKLGLKSPNALHKLQAGGLEFGSTAPRVHGYVPATVEHYQDNGTISSRIEPFIMLYSRKSKEEFKVTLAKIPKIQTLIEEHELDATRLMFATNGKKEDENKLVKLLKEQDIQVLYSLTQNVPAKLLINAYTPSPDVLRAVAKIAFNYFAFLCEKNDQQMPLRPEFDKVRNYIHKNESFTDMVLLGEGLLLGSTQDHCCALRYAETEGKTLPVVFVSLFNGFTYSVVLTRASLPTALPDEQAHQWRLKSKTVGRVLTNLHWPVNL